MYGSFESLYCTPETTTTLYANYTRIKIKNLIINKMPRMGQESGCLSRSQVFILATRQVGKTMNKRLLH